MIEFHTMGRELVVPLAPARRGSTRAALAGVVVAVAAAGVVRHARAPWPLVALVAILGAGVSLAARWLAVRRGPRRELRLGTTVLTVPDDSGAGRGTIQVPLDEVRKVRLVVGGDGGGIVITTAAGRRIRLSVRTLPRDTDGRALATRIGLRAALAKRRVEGAAFAAVEALVLAPEDRRFAAIVDRSADGSPVVLATVSDRAEYEALVAAHEIPAGAELMAAADFVDRPQEEILVGQRRASAAPR